MSKFTTSRDRIMRATGENSTIDWSQVPADIAEELLSRIGKGKSEEDIPDSPASACQERIVTVFGYDLTFSQALQLTSVFLQMISLIMCIVIAIHTRRNS